MQNSYNFKVGDIVKVFQNIKEAKKDRIVSFRGRVVKMKGAGDNKTFTVRQNIEGIEVDKIFPVASPTIAKIEFVESPKKRIKKANLLRKVIKK
ncbi:MAG: 50S ribosomal protein L19 [Patescibacteria group bacterium]|nr:50S ribosomal protein L19 [Patescibacteria group bacterium]MCL5113869.1 50S ribosomal protein L19 [Patescibacteria group bacterium]